MIKLDAFGKMHLIKIKPTMTENNFLLITEIERAMSDILRGLPFIFHDNEKNYLIFSAELFSEKIFSSLFKNNINFKFYDLIITNEKAKKINVNNSYSNSLIKNLKFSEIINIIDNNKTLIDKNNIYTVDDNISKYGIALMKELRLLPYIVIKEIDEIAKKSLSINLQILNVNLINKYFDIKNNRNSMQEIARSKIALKNAENSEIIIFRDLPNFGKIHLMILVGKQNLNTIPYIRIHSGCYTGDLLASLQCDCRDQLQETIKYLNKMWTENEIYGGIIYQAVDEGRAIGLINKIRAYRLQSCNCNTIDANYEIGYEDDERDFISASNILKLMSIDKCKLITNNPKKIHSLNDLGIEIVDRVSILSKSNKYNKKYLDIKFTEMSHMNY